MKVYLFVITKTENYMPSGVLLFGFDSESELYVLQKTLTCGYAVKSSNVNMRYAELVYTTKSQGIEPTFLSSTARM